MSANKGVVVVVVVVVAYQTLRDYTLSQKLARTGRVYSPLSIFEVIPDMILLPILHLNASFFLCNAREVAMSAVSVVTLKSLFHDFVV